jgi:hypothetical protein
MTRASAQPVRFAPAILALLALGLGETSLWAQEAKAPAPPMLDVAKPPPAPKPRTATVTLSADGQTVYVVGMLLEGSFHQFDAVMLKAPKVRTVHLSSAGGYTLEARLMASLVRKRKLDTYVESYCASACTQVFAAGRSRVIGPFAQLGFHQASLVDEKSGTTLSREVTDRKLTVTSVFGVNGNDTLRLAYELAGVDPAFTTKALSYSHENMWLPSPKELIDARVATRQASQSELPPPPGSLGTRDEVRARLIATPLWRTALVRIPVPAEAAVDEVWRSASSGATFEEAAFAGRAKLVTAATIALAEAPDALLDRSLAFYAKSAGLERSRGYPGCKSALGVVPVPSDPAYLELIGIEDALIVDFMTTTERTKRLDGAEATRYFTKEVVPLIAPLFYKGSTKGQEGKCRLGFQMFETIDAMPKKKRLKAYRALLSLPAMAELE